MAEARRTALKILTNIERSKSYSHLALKEALSGSGLSAEDTAFVSRLVYGTVERKITIDYYIRCLAGRGTAGMHPLVRNVLRLGLYQIFYMDKVPDSAAVNESVRLTAAGGQRYAKGFVNAVLRNAARERDKLSLPAGDAPDALEIRYSCPRRLIEKWIADYGKEAANLILESMQAPRLHAARVNTLKTTRKELLRCLSNEGVSAEPSEPENCVVLARLPDLSALPSFKEGLFHIQGAVSQQCCLELSPQPGESVLDLCAAPGGKSFTMAEMMGNRGQIVSCDVYENRLGLIRQGVERLGIRIIETAANDASLHNENLGLFDRVLCDVPCSGFGVMGGKPEIKYKSLDEIKDLPALQYSILKEGASHVRGGGTLLYSTCTLNKDENEAVAGKFLAENSGFELLPIADGEWGYKNKEGLPELMGSGKIKFMKTFFPEPGKAEGFFIAGFRKK